MATICMITTVHKHDDIRIYHKEAKAAAEGGYDVYIISPNYSGKSDEGIKFIGLSKYSGRFKRVLLGSREAYKEAIKVEADIYHIHDPELLSMAVKLKRKGKKVIYDAHEDFEKQLQSKEWISPMLRPYISKLLGGYEVKQANKLDMVITATEEIAKRFKKKKVVHNYPVTEEYNKNAQNTPYPLRENNICYIGLLNSDRGVVQMVRSMKDVEGKLILAGEYDSTEFRLLTSKLPEYEKVDYRGYISRSAVWELLDECKIGLLILQATPSYKESVPIKLFEYMAAGLPVIASNFPKWREMVGVGCCVFVDPLNTEEIKSAIIRLLKAPDIAIKMGEEGKKLVEKKFNFGREKEKLLTAYAEIIGENN